MICKIRTVSTNLLERDTAHTLSARSSTLYQTPVRRMMTTGSKERQKQWNDWIAPGSSRRLAPQQTDAWKRLLRQVQSNICDHDIILNKNMSASIPSRMRYVCLYKRSGVNWKRLISWYR